MKIKYLFPLLIIAVSSALFSCSKFLEETSKDEIIPRSVTDYKELIYGEIYNNINAKSIHSWLDVMSDDCEEFVKKASLGSDTRNSGFGYFTWQRAPEMQPTGVVSDDNAWNTYYHNILVTNMILFDIDDKVGSDSEKAQVKAEAYMIRAYSYYMLVNLYGEPYTPATAEQAKGVPLNNLVGAQIQKFKRVSVAENYRVIKSDIKNALENFNLTSENPTIFRWNKRAALIFASRVALYTQDWDAAIDYATQSLVIKSILWDLNEKAVQGAESLNETFFNKRNPEIAFTYGYFNITYFAIGAKGAFPTSAALKAMYKSGDLRYGANDGAFIRNQGSTFLGGGKRYVQFKSDSPSNTQVFGSAIRTAEAYLNRAEAYIMRGDLTEAMDDINRLRRYRIKSINYVELPEGEKEEVIALVRDERRRELCFEQHRWFDLRRWDRPSITHIFTPDYSNLASRVKYVLEENDAAYTLPVPSGVLIQDSDLEDIERPDRGSVAVD